MVLVVLSIPLFGHDRGLAFLLLLVAMWVAGRARAGAADAIMAFLLLPAIAYFMLSLWTFFRY
jgi:hypothetical protein